MAVCLPDYTEIFKKEPSNIIIPHLNVLCDTFNAQLRNHGVTLIMQTPFSLINPYYTLKLQIKDMVFSLLTIVPMDIKDFPMDIHLESSSVFTVENEEEFVIKLNEIFNSDLIKKHIRLMLEIAKR